MSNLFLAFSVVFPLFFMMLVGYFLRAIHALNPVFIGQLSAICFKLFLPLSLFCNVYRSDFKTLFSPKLIIFALLSLVIAFFIFMKIVPFLEKDPLRCGVVIQGIFRCNFILFGIPITTSLFGEENIAIAAILLAFVVPTVNVLSVVALESFSGKKTSKKAILHSVLKNPLIIAAFIGFCFVLTGMRLPQIVEKPIFDIANVATPLALIALGGSFQLDSLKRTIKPLLITVLGKLVVMPVLFLPMAIALGFRNVELAAILAMLASPTAVSSYTMAQTAGLDGELAGQVVVATSIISVLTIFFWIALLKTFVLI